MPIPENVCRVHLNWTLGSDEIAVSTFHMQLQHGAGNDLDWSVAPNVLATKVAQKWATNMTSQAGLFGAAVALRDVSVYHLDATTEKTLDKGQFVLGGATTWAGSGGACLPFEVAVAVSLYAYTPGTFVPNRASLRGRFYLPPIDASALGNGAQAGRLGPSSQSALASALGNFANDIHHTSADQSGDNPLGGEDWWSLGVLSRKRGEFHRVTTLRVGDVPDVQKRRRNKLAEGYQDRTITDG